MTTFTVNQNITVRRCVMFLLLCAMLLFALAGPAPVRAAETATIDLGRMAGPPTTSWAQFGFDMRRTSFNPFENVLGVGNAGALRLAWSTALPMDPATRGFVIYGSPIYFGGRLYARAADGLYGLDPVTGAIIINYRTGGAILGAPAAAGGLRVLGEASDVLFVGSTDGSIYGIDTTDARPNPLWQASVGAGIQTSLLLIGSQIPPGPCLAPGPCQIVFGAGDTLYTYDTDGNRLWEAALNGEISSAPSASGDPKFPWIFVGTQSGMLYAVNAADGSVAWLARLDGVPGIASIGDPTLLGDPHLIGDPTIVGDPHIYVATSAGSLYSLNAADGSLRWKFTTGGAILGGPALGDVNGDGVAEVVVGSQDGDIYALDQTDAKPLWVARLGARIAASPALANGVLYLVAEGGDISRGDPGILFTLNAATGAVLTQVGLQARAHASPIVADGQVFIATDDGRVYLFVPVAE